MIRDKVQFNHNGLKIQANYSKNVIPCKKIKFTIKGQSAVISRDDLYALLMLFGDDKQQEFLIPIKEQEMEEVSRMITIKAKKDVKKGDEIRIVYTYLVPKKMGDNFATERVRYNEDEKVEKEVAKKV